MYSATGTTSISSTSSSGESESTKTTSSAPRCEVSYSMFGDGSCGEPSLTQHLTLDFEPLEDVDSDFVQRKCCTFWEFVESRPELKHLMVYPEKSFTQDQTANGDDSSTPETIKSDNEDKYVKDERTAVSMLEFVENKGLIDRIFEAKLPQTTCSLGSREYHESEGLAALELMRKGKKVCTCPGVKPKPVDAIRTPINTLCKNMREWDNEHPKSMEPPGHPPTLIHSIMQRKIIS